MDATEMFTVRLTGAQLKALRELGMSTLEYAHFESEQERADFDGGIDALAAARPDTYDAVIVGNVWGVCFSPYSPHFDGESRPPWAPKEQGRGPRKRYTYDRMSRDGVTRLIDHMTAIADALDRNGPNVGTVTQIRRNAGRLRSMLAGTTDDVKEM